MKQKHNDGRVRFWLPESKRDLLTQIDQLVALRESEQGIPSSRSSVIVKLIENGLRCCHGSCIKEKNNN